MVLFIINHVFSYNVYFYILLCISVKQIAMKVFYTASRCQPEVKDVCIPFCEKCEIFVNCISCFSPIITVK